MTTIRYFDIGWLSRHDGPGCRVVLFLQGCHLRCPWCHSPHSWGQTSPLLFFADSCRLCGRCAQACPRSVHQIGADGRHRLDRERCRQCGSCVDACPDSALSLPTVATTVDQLWSHLAPQLRMLRSIGGITFSGGEALLQAEALRELLLLCREAGVHTAVETSGTLPRHHFEAVADLVGCWLFGLRPTPAYVPPGTDAILPNLRFLAGRSGQIIIRMPVVAAMTDGPESLAEIAAAMQACGLTELQLLPCNPETAHYYRASGQLCRVGPAAIPAADRLAATQHYFEERGITATVTS